MKTDRRFVLAALLSECWSGALRAYKLGDGGADRFLIGASNGEAWEGAA